MDPLIVAIGVIGVSLFLGIAFLFGKRRGFCILVFVTDDRAKQWFDDALRNRGHTILPNPLLQTISDCKTLNLVITEELVVLKYTKHYRSSVKVIFVDKNEQGEEARTAGADAILTRVDEEDLTQAIEQVR